MMAILLDRPLQSVANYLILSLALADLLVAVLVMPLGAVNEVGQSSSVEQCNTINIKIALFKTIRDFISVATSSDRLVGPHLASS